MDALRQTLLTVNPKKLRKQLDVYVAPDVQKILAGSGIRDEYVFPTPAVLETRPSLVGYYRLLLGLPQKTFYAGDAGMGRFRSMEEKNTISANQSAGLHDFCEAMSPGLSDLVRQISPAVSRRDIVELPLLTIGSQFQGATNVSIGKKATEGVFIAIGDIVKGHVQQKTTRKITVKNSAGRAVVIELAADPDVRIMEDFGGSVHKKVALEIKGGTDRSNAHERAGAAEKSHQKAKDQGFRDFWTIIAKKGVDERKLRRESPTTRSWFDAEQVLGQEGPEWEEFKRRLSDAVGIPTSK